MSEDDTAISTAGRVVVGALVGIVVGVLVAVALLSIFGNDRHPAWIGAYIGGCWVGGCLGAFIGGVFGRPRHDT